VYRREEMGEMKALQKERETMVALQLCVREIEKN